MAKTMRRGLTQLLDEVETKARAYTRQARSRVSKAAEILRGEMEVKDLVQLAGKDFEDRFRAHVRSKGLTDSQEMSRVKGLRAILNHGQDEGYLKCPPFGPLRNGQRGGTPGRARWYKDARRGSAGDRKP